ncbi:MAG: glycosyltransferase [Pirellulales bacterium]
MRIRFQRLTTVYPEFARRFLAGTTDVDGLGYAALYARLAAARFAESDYHARHMRALGHEAENSFLSLEPLQRRWAAENGVAFRDKHWLADIAVEQVRAFQPDVLFLDDLYVLDRPLRNRLRRACESRPLVIGWRAAPTDDFSGFDDLDLVLTSIRGMAESFRRAGANAAVLHHGFEASVLDEFTPPPVRDIDFSFAGGLSNLHPERATMVTTLLARTPVEIWGANPHVRIKDRLRWMLSRAGMPLKPKYRMRTLPLAYPGRIHPAVFGLDYYDVLARSKIVLNRHIGCAGEDASNMRMFEATGMGACLLTDNKRNMSELFEPGVEVVTYDSVDDAVEKVDYLLRHDDQREAIAAAGQRRTFTEHSFAGRVNTLAGMIAEQFCRKAA